MMFLRKKERCFIFCLIFISTFFFFSAVRPTFANVEDIRQKIADRENAIKKLEEEISATEKQINSSRSEQKTLKSAIAVFDAERKKFLAQIKITEKKIEAREFEIEVLGLDINDKIKRVGVLKNGLAAAVRFQNAMDMESLITAYLNNPKMSDLWNYLDQSTEVKKALLDKTEQLKNLKENLEKDKNSAELIKKQLVNLKSELNLSKKSAENSKNEREKLLKATQNKESEYQKILAKQLATKEAFEKELLEFESQLRFEIDPNSLPPSGKKVLRWPLDINIKITQYFGKTAFATANPQIYNGMGHNGIDFHAPIGTPIKSSASGFVAGFGNTDIACPGASYGKWIMIEHRNGLSTLYAHLSSFSVVSGQEVQEGETIGLSGNTGYSTGPHLHFTVFASQGVRIMERRSKVCNGIYIMPVADYRAYLNPLSYL